MSSLWVSVVTISTGRCLSWLSALICFSSSKPSMLGMLMSEITKSCGSARSLASASMPSSASAVSAQPMSASMTRTIRRIVAKSSTIRNFSAALGPMSLVVGSARRNMNGAAAGTAPGRP